MDEEDKKLADEVLKETMKVKELTLSISEIVPMGEFRNTKPMMSITWDGDIDFEKAQQELKDRFSAWLPSIINKAEHNLQKEETKNMCSVHSIAMSEAVSKKTGKPYKFHRQDKQMCFGSGFV